MVARGAIDNPYIFGEIKQYLSVGELLPQPSIEDRIKLLVEHLNLAVQFKGERKACFEIRKHYSGYLRNFPGVSKLRIDLMQFTESQSIINRLNDHLISIHLE
ncbi:MAG: tRNA-dihydrouridine synthase [Ignavibacteriales bacterium]|nr:tRNA-dihydrouridine synthase [Ignavibacteriales bacterium]